jgi:hypothetical protein
MPTTAGGIHYPASSDSIDIPGDLQLLAEDVEAYITANAVTTTGTYTLTNKTLTSPIVTGTGVVFEGATADAFETTLTVVDPTADNTITLPNVSGTVITTGNLTDVTDLQSFTGTIVFEGTTADAYELTLSAGDPTADRTVTLPDLTGTVALTNQKLSVFAATSSSELAGVISDETGSGALVFGNSPTLSTPTVSGLTLSDASIVFEGATADAYETTITVVDPTADRTITFPNASGTVALADSVDATASTLSGLEIAVIMSAF